MKMRIKDMTLDEAVKCALITLLRANKAAENLERFIVCYGEDMYGYKIAFAIRAEAGRKPSNCKWYRELGTYTPAGVSVIRLWEDMIETKFFAPRPAHKSNPVPGVADSDGGEPD